MELTLDHEDVGVGSRSNLCNLCMSGIVVACCPLTVQLLLWV